MITTIRGMRKALKSEELRLSLRLQEKGHVEAEYASLRGSLLTVKKILEWI